MTTPRFERHVVALVKLTGPEAAAHMQRLAGIVDGIGGASIRASSYLQEFPSLSEAEQQRQKSLDMDIRDLLKEIKGSRGNMYSQLLMNGVRQVRDVFVLGRMGMERVCRFSTRQNQIMYGALALHYPGERFLLHPTPADNAGVCIELDQVHAGVIPNFWKHLDRSDRRPLDKYLSLNRVTVDELFTEGPKLPPNHYLLPTYDHAVATLEATEYTGTFLEARAALLHSPTVEQ